MNNITMTVTIFRYDQYYITFKDIVGYMLNENSRLLVLQHPNKGITVYNLDFISHYEIRTNEVTENEQT